MWSRCCLIFLAISIHLLAQQKNPPVTLTGIEVQGTHLPQDSILKLLRIQVGQTVDSDNLKAACERVLSTGLVADIHYSFKQETAGPKGVIVFKVADETNLLPATIVPARNEAAMWACLQGSSAIFEKSLPNTKDALRFYVLNMNQCITTTSNQPLHAVAKVLCDADQKPEKIEFRIEPGPVEEPDSVTVVIVKP